MKTNWNDLPIWFQEAYDEATVIICSNYISILNYDEDGEIVWLKCFLDDYVTTDISSNNKKILKALYGDDFEDEYELVMAVPQDEQGQ